MKLADSAYPSRWAISVTESDPVASSFSPISGVGPNDCNER